MSFKEFNMNNSRLGVLGGSGLYNIESLKNVREIVVETPFGDPSDVFKIGNIEEMEVVFLARHGKSHHLLPTEVPYKANIWAMKSLGVKWLVSASAVGSLSKEVKPLDMVVPDQFIDRTHQRPLSFFGDGVVAHVSMADPFCKNLSKILCDVATPLMPEDRTLHNSGTYLCMEGPAFSTRAESFLYKSWGCSIIGMTNHTEARLAKEAEIAYSTLAMSTDYDCWYEDHDDVTVEMIVSNLKENAKLANCIIENIARKISQIRPLSSSHTALENSILTSSDNITPAMKKKLELFIEKYIN